MIICFTCVATDIQSVWMPTVRDLSWELCCEEEEVECILTEPWNPFYREMSETKIILEVCLISTVCQLTSFGIFISTRECREP